MGEARNGACVGDLHHAWFLPNRPDLTVFGMNRALGVTAVSVRAEPAGLTRIRRRTYIPLTLPILDGSPRVIAARSREGRDVTGGGRMNDARLVRPANASFMGFAAADPHCCCAGS